MLASAEMIGQYVEPAVFLKLSLPHLKSASTTSVQQTASVLKILTALVQGTSEERIKPHLKVKDYFVSMSVVKSFLSLRKSYFYTCESTIFLPCEEISRTNQDMKKL